MIEILGKLGVDGYMLIAQIINFIILLWLLNRYLYKPIIREVEKNESMLNEAEEKNKTFAEQKAVFETEKKEFLVQMKKVSQTIVSEAKKVAEKIEFNAQVEVEKLKQKLIKQTKNQVTNEKKALANKHDREILSQKQAALIEHVKERLVDLPELQNQLQNSFFSLLLQNLTLVTSELGSKKPKTSKPITPDFSAPLSEKQIKKLKNIVDRQDARPVNLNFTTPLSTDQLDQLKSLLSQQNVIHGDLITNQDSALICGYQLSIDGYLVEANLLNEITKAYEE